jgi:hypothetical protein
MTGLTSLYDVSTTPDDQGMLTVGGFIATTFGIFALLIVLWTRTKYQPFDPYGRASGYMVAALALAVAIGAAGYDTWRSVELSRWKANLSAGRFELLDGCVSNFSEELQRGGLLGVDSFSLNGHSFFLSDSGWRLGYHRSWHDGSLIGPGAHLRVAADGPHLLRIEIYPEPCGAKSGV